MKIDVGAVRKALKSFDFPALFREHLGWDRHQGRLEIPIDGKTIHLSAVAQKRGFVAYVCSSIPDRPLRLKIDHQITKSAREHFVIYSDQDAGQQVWQWVRREPGKPLASRDHRFDAKSSGDALIQRLERIAVSMEEEETIALPDVAGKAKAAFDVDKVTKKFYDRFKAEHAAFLKFIKGIKAQGDLEWYTSLMLNRMMFVYFIQKKGFLDGDTNYLQSRMKQVRDLKGKDKFQSFYRYFLLRLFHEGLGKHETERKLDRDLEKLLGKVPYLNGGFFEVHQLEESNPEIDIPDRAFEKLFAFFDEFSWHLDERPMRAGNEINPDVVGYIFEKYINQKQMGAYYTKEDITEYISKNTIIPFLFGAAEKKCPIAFKPDSFLWRLLRDDPDRYIYPAMRHGVMAPGGDVAPLPPAVAQGLTDVAKRGGWNRPASEPYALPTETWREHVARRQRCLELRDKLRKGEVHEINDLITLNLDIWQFARDAIGNSEGPELLRAFWQAIQQVTVLDPACGSGAFLFAALRILETLYSDCLERMEQFVEELALSNHHPEKFKDFKAVLAQIGQHPSDKYFILKSIIISNLFGVDIMEEAVEICKLRLFLKLVAQVENVGQIEPLPDIDFNIRAGNTLVGYVSLNEVKASLLKKYDKESAMPALLDSDASPAVARIEEEALTVERCFKQFRAQQTKHGGKVTLKDKQDLRRRLAKLDQELDRYLASEYGIDLRHQKSFDAWKKSHLPFHWFVEFYGIMKNGGFDVVIGNPPYVEYKDVRNTYTVRGLKTLPCGDLYAFCTERGFYLLSNTGRLGLILPISIFGTDGFESLQRLSIQSLDPLWVSSFANRPSQLFDGAQKRLTILLGRRSDSEQSIIFTGRYYRWTRDEFPSLFQGRIEYAPPHRNFAVFEASLEKLGSALEVSAFQRVTEVLAKLSDALRPNGSHRVFYTRKFGYFLAFLDSVPRITELKTGRQVLPSELKELAFDSLQACRAAIAILSSSTFFWFWNVLSDCRNLNRRDLLAFTVNPDIVASSVKRQLALLGDRYLAELKQTSTTMVKSGLEIQTFRYGECKPVIDEIDIVLAQHYGFAPEELDFIINYDIKYRMGQDETDTDESP